MTRETDTIRVACKQRTCTFFTADPLERAGYCLCTHKEKRHHMETPCTLYRMDMGNSDTTAGAALADMF